MLTAFFNLKPKYNNFDDISAFFLKTFTTSLNCFCSNYIFLNIFFSLHHFPKNVNMLLLFPIFKTKGSVNDVPKYRSISCASVSSKVPESLVKECLLAQFMANNLPSNAQISFLAGPSKITNLFLRGVHDCLRKAFTLPVFVYS